VLTAVRLVLHPKHTAKNPQNLNLYRFARHFLACVRCFALDILMLQKLKQTWFSNVRGDVLAGIVVALALIPEAIAFSIIAGVDPKVGLYASFCIV
jgi:hypothetical protein